MCVNEARPDYCAFFESFKIWKIAKVICYSMIPNISIILLESSQVSPARPSN